MEKPDVEKIRQLLENKQAGNILLGMQLIQTFGLEKEFLTEICYLGYFINTDVSPAAQQTFSKLTSEQLHKELEAQTKQVYFPEEILEGIGILFKPEYSSIPLIDRTRLVQKYLKDYYYYPAQILNFLLEHKLDLSQFEFLEEMEELSIQYTIESLPLERFHSYFPNVKHLVIENNPLAFSNPPFEIFKQLETISIAHNQLKSLPQEITEAKFLTSLVASDNELEELPKEFGELSHLAHLELQENQLNKLPESFGKLQTLEFLNLRDNLLNTLPNSIQDLSNLRGISLENNQLTQIPFCLLLLSNLRELMLDNNPLALELLPTNLEQMSELQHLGFSGNQLSTIPDFVFTMPRLQYLRLANNHLTYLPEQLPTLKLRQLDLSHNQLTSFSYKLVNPHFIKEINLRGNPIFKRVIKQLRLDLPDAKIVF